MTNIENDNALAINWMNFTTWVKSRKLANLHRHVTGSLSSKSISSIYKMNPQAQERFKTHYSSNSTSSDDIDAIVSSSLQKLPKGWSNFEDAFMPGYILLSDDPFFRMHREWLQQIVLESDRDGISLVGIRGTFGGKWRSEDDFERAITAAVEGVMDGESQASNKKTRAIIIVCIRKNTPIFKARRILVRLVDIRKRWEKTNPSMAKTLYGVDSIGFEEQFDLFDHLDIFSNAADNGFKVFYHIGEQWSPGTLQEKLHQMNNLLKNIQISYITNPVALLIDSATLDKGLYPRGANHYIQSLQNEILEKLTKASTVLEVSPTSNDILTRQLRQLETWKFLPLHEFLEKGLTFVIGDDNGGIFETNYLEEFRKLYFGETSLGQLDIPFLKRLVLNSEKICNSINSDLYQEEPKNEFL